MIAGGELCCIHLMARYTCFVHSSWQVSGEQLWRPSDSPQCLSAIYPKLSQAHWPYLWEGQLQASVGSLGWKRCQCVPIIPGDNNHLGPEWLQVWKAPSWSEALIYLVIFKYDCIKFPGRSQDSSDPQGHFRPTELNSLGMKPMKYEF